MKKTCTQLCVVGASVLTNNVPLPYLRTYERERDLCVYFTLKTLPRRQSLFLFLQCVSLLLHRLRIARSSLDHFSGSIQAKLMRNARSRGLNSARTVGSAGGLTGSRRQEGEKAV